MIMRLFLRCLSGTGKQAVKYSAWHTEEISPSLIDFFSISSFHFSYYCLWIPPKQGLDKDLVQVIYLGADHQEAEMKDQGK